MSSLPTVDAIPDLLLQYDQWVCWTETTRDGKPTKIPIDPRTGRYGSATDADTWGTFEVAHKRARADGLSGVGFVFTEADPIVGVDLDDCRIPETGATVDWATGIMDMLDSFTEVSPSGTGVHILINGSVPGDRSRNGDVEIYETARFFTVTGNRVDGRPPKIHDRHTQLAEVYERHIAPETERADPAVMRNTSDTSGADATAGQPPVVDLSDQALL